MNKPRGRSFQPGNQLGQGRPKGSRNRPRPGDDLLDQFAPHVMGECIRRALKEGDRTALRLCVERVSPTRRGAPLSFKLPAIRSAEDAERAVAKVAQALHRGQCTPAEATEVMKFLQAHARLLEDLQWEGRLDKLEQMVEERKGRI
ncbi:MAG TPA: hypothetical protein VIY49_09645 [Bryobacteraceae bacterium]